MQLSDHLSLEEFTHSDTAIKHNLNNSLPDSLLPSAKLLAINLFEPIRSLLNVPLKVNSGFRSTELNVLVRGVKTSQHTKAEAIDIIPIGLDIKEAFTKISNSSLLWDQLILEHDAVGNIWIHVSLKTTKNARQRKQIISSLLKKN